MKLITRSLSLVALLGIASIAHADILMDQITGATLITGVSPGADQVFTDFSAFSCLVMDDFTTTGGYQLNHASIVLEGSYNPTGFQVSVWNSLANAASSGNGLNGNAVAQQLVPIASVTKTNIGDNFRIDVPINLALPTAGTYYLGIAPVQAFGGNGQLYMLGATTGNPGGNNSIWINPGGGFGAGTSAATGVNAGLRLEGRALSTPVPEPGSVALLVGMASLGSMVICRKRK